MLVDMFTKSLMVLTATLASLLAVACGSGDDGDSNTIVVGGDQDFTTVIATSEQVVGPNRFVIGILGPDNTPVVDAKVHLKFFDISGATPVQKFETDAASIVPARDAGLTEQVIHTHTDGTKHVHVNAGDDVGVYVANVDFDRTGNWGVEVNLDSKEPKIKGTQRVQFNVIDRSVTPPVGSPAPRSRNLTLNDVADITEIDSSSSPLPDFHTTTIADAVEAGRPSLVLFAVPGFCDSRFCGPEYEIMKKLHSEYKERLDFIHVEFYKQPGSPQREPADAVREWGLRSEPWFFLIDSRGLIAAKFEGPTSRAELEEAIRKLG
jgi:hypothetical protein